MALETVAADQTAQPLATGANSLYQMASDEAGSAGDQNHYCASSQFTCFPLAWGVVRTLT
jgi:hypothetical protein